MAHFFYFRMKINIFGGIFNQNYSEKKFQPLSALELTLSGLIMGSRVDTAGDNQSPNVIISNHFFIKTYAVGAH